MAEALQIHRRIGSAGAPAALEAGQLAYNRVGAGGPDNLYVGDGSAVQTLIASTRQVELAGAQTITGAKTIDIANLHILGGDDGDILATDGAGALAWQAAPPASVVVASPGALSGNGLVATPLSLTVATGTQVAAGTDAYNPITSATLRGVIGADAAALETTAQTVVPAINELLLLIQALEGPLRLVGTYAAATNQVTPGTNSPAVAGALPAAAEANSGWVFIVTGTGTGVAPAPAVPLSAGDWLVSDGGSWLHIDLNAPATVAANVAVTAISGLTAGDVQAALAEIVGGGAVPVAVDGVTVGGDGTTGDPLEVLGYDDGTY